MAEQIKDSEAVGKPLEATKEAKPVESAGQSEQDTNEQEPEAETSEGDEQNAEAETDTSGSWTNLLEPRAIFGVLPLALIDLTGIVLVCVALDDFFITDIIAFSYFSMWKKICYPEKPTTIEVQEIQGVGQQRRATIQKTREAAQQSAQKATAELAKGVKKAKWLAPVLTICEIIPYIGALPFWTILAINTAKNG